MGGRFAAAAQQLAHSFAKDANEWGIREEETIQLRMFC
jgi:hypothetical protein